MDVRDSLKDVYGDWKGHNQVILYPGADPLESEIELRAAYMVKDKFIVMDYNWDEGGPQIGHLLVGRGDVAGEVRVVWLDSWHNKDRMMVMAGQVNPDGTASVSGSYPAEEGPDWGWRIELHPPKEDSFLIEMYNITPEGEEALAVVSEMKKVN